MKGLRIRVFGKDHPSLTAQVGDGRLYADFDTFLAVPTSLTRATDVMFEITCATPVTHYQVGDYEAATTENGVRYEATVFATGKMLCVASNNLAFARLVVGKYLAVMGRNLSGMSGKSHQEFDQLRQNAAKND